MGNTATRKLTIFDYLGCVQEPEPDPDPLKTGFAVFVGNSVFKIASASESEIRAQAVELAASTVYFGNHLPLPLVEVVEIHERGLTDSFAIIEPRISGSKGRYVKPLDPSIGVQGILFSRLKSEQTQAHYHDVPFVNPSFHTPVVDETDPGF